MNIPQHLMSECNIQSQFYHHCIELGMNCTLELMTPAGRVDAAIFSENWENLIAVVECKKGYFNTNSKQFCRYRKLGVSVYGLGNILYARETALTISKITERGICWDSISKLPRFERGNNRQRRYKRTNYPLEVDEMINFKS